MGQHKFEQEFGRKLREREIKPSEGSWERLQGRLDQEEKNTSRFPFRWLSVAACIAAGIFIWSLAFDSEKIQQTPEVVNTPSEEIIVKEEYAPEEEVYIASEDKKSEEEVKPEVEQSREAIVNTSVHEDSAIAMAGKEKTASEESAIEEMSSGTLALQQDLTNGMEKDLVPEIEDVIAHIATKEEAGPEITDAEIEAMLENAAAELALEHDSAAIAENIDAGSLLWEAEMELERSFRDKVLEVLKDGYMKTRTAVANHSF